MEMYFLMCSERSGSNFITKLLNGHSLVCGPSTKHIINPVARNLFRYGDLSKEENWNELLTDMHRMINVKFSVWKKEFGLDELKSLAPAGEIGLLIKNIFLAEAKANGKRHVFVKENHVYEFILFLLLNYPKAKYVYQVRDPRDMALSWKKSSDHPGGVVNAARQWQKDQQNSLKNYSELAKRGQAYFVKYEDLISDPQKYLADLLNFLGLPEDKNIENFHKDELTVKNAGMQKTWNNLSQGIISDNKDKYQKELTESEIMAIEKICFFEMYCLGYKTNYKKNVLDNLSNEDVEKLSVYEFENIICNRSEGVKENMKAKEIFYKKTHKIIL